jgi:hypothetical protein
VLEGVAVRREPFAREQRRHEPAARALPRVQGFGHRAEIGLGARRERSAERKSRFDLVDGESEEARARGGHREHAERRRRVPTFFGMPGIEGEADARRFESRGVREEQVLAGARMRIARSDERRDHDRRDVAADVARGIVEVERVGGRAVDQRGIERTRPAARAENQARTAGGRTDHHVDQPRRVFFRARESHAQRIEQRDLAPVDCFFGQIAVFDGGNTLRQLARQAHESPPPVKDRIVVLSLSAGK